MTLAVLTLLFAGYGDYRSFAPVLGFGVFVTLIAGLTLMPALLAVLGRRAFWPRVPREGDATEHKPWRRVAETVAAAPKRSAAVVAAVLVVLALGCLLYSPRFSFTEDFLKDMPSKQGYALLERHFPKGALAPTTVLLQRHGRPAGVRRARHPRRLRTSRRASPRPSSRARRGRRTGSSYQVILKGDPYSKEALAAGPRPPRRWRARRPPLGGRRPSSAAPPPSRPTPGRSRTATRSSWPSRRSVVVGVILMVLLRALVAPLYLLATNVLSYLAALGLTIFITEVLLGWERISYRIPLYMFIFLVALGSDYNIFITTRIRGEAMKEGLRDGTVKAVAATGGVLTSAGIILAGTFLILLSQPVKDLAEISIGVALGVLIDTFLVRTALVPGLTLAVGPRAGWPGPRWTRPA